MSCFLIGSDYTAYPIIMKTG